MSTEKKEFGIDNPLVDSNSPSSTPDLDNSLVSNDQEVNDIQLTPKQSSSETNEVLDQIELTKDPVVSQPVQTPVTQTSASHVLHNQIDWPIDPDHENAADLLSKPVSEREFHFDNLNNDLPDIAVPKVNKPLNFLLFVLVLLVGFGGLFTVGYYSSPNREARMKEDAECRVEANTLEQLTKQKSYGALRIESKPTQARVLQSDDGGKTFKAIRGKTADGQEMDVLTSATVNNIDINNNYVYKVELDGHKSETFVISRYQWILDGATGSYRFQKTVNLTPDACASWYTFNWKSNKAQEFDSAEKCSAEFSKDSAESTSCRCLAKAFTPPVPPEAEKAPK